MPALGRPRPLSIDLRTSGDLCTPLTLWLTFLISGDFSTLVSSHGMCPLLLTQPPGMPSVICQR